MGEYSIVPARPVSVGVCGEAGRDRGNHRAVAFISFTSEFATIIEIIISQVKSKHTCVRRIFSIVGKNIHGRVTGIIIPDGIGNPARQPERYLNDWVPERDTGERGEWVS